MVGVGLALVLAYFVMLSGAMRWRIELWIGLLLLAVSFTRYLVDFGSVTVWMESRGIASEVPGLSSPDIVIIALAALGAVLGFKNGGWQWVFPGICGLLFGALFLWPHDKNVVAGVVHLTICLIAWPVGNWLGRRASQSPETGRGIAFAIFAFCGIQLALCALQIESGSSDLLHGRAEGTFLHPSMLGKLVVILLILILPMTQSADKYTARFSVLAAAGGCLAIIATMSRANIAGVFVMLVIWLTFTRLKSNTRWKAVAVASMIAIAALPLQDKVLERFQTDLDGGDRPALWDAGLRVVSQHLWIGVGPNNFVEAAGASEHVVAMTGQPVHNTLLMSLAELGLIIAILFYLPLLRTCYTAITSTKRGVGGHIGPVLLIGCGAVLLIGWTGWGFLVNPIAVLLFFVFGFVNGQLRFLLAEPSSSAFAQHPARLREHDHVPRL